MGYIAPSTIFNIYDPGESHTCHISPSHPPGCSQRVPTVSAEVLSDEGETKLWVCPAMATLLFVLAAVPGQLLFIEVNDHLRAADAHLTRWEQGHILRVFPFD